MSGVHETGVCPVLSFAGFSLRAIGRQHEAFGPLEDGRIHHLKQQSWNSASIASRNVSNLMMVDGFLDEALTVAADAVRLADYCRVPVERIASRAVLADALHHRGQLRDAQAHFVEAESLQAGWWPDQTVLVSVSGYQYGDLLLTMGQIAEAQRRAQHLLSNATSDNSPADIALFSLLLGRAVGDARFIDEAILGVRKASRLDYLPPCILARAALHRTAARFADAHRDLNEARTIAERGGMRLHLCDFHLESARLHLAEHNPEAARRAYETAKSEVEAMGYHRRDPELAALAAALGDG